MLGLGWGWELEFGGGGGGWVGIRGRCSGMGMGCRREGGREGDWADGWIRVGVPSGQLFTMNYKF